MLQLFLCKSGALCTHPNISCFVQPYYYQHVTKTVRRVNNTHLVVILSRMTSAALPNAAGRVVPEKLFATEALSWVFQNGIYL